MASVASFSLAIQVGSNLNDVQLQQLVDRTIIQGDKDKDGKLSYEVRQRRGQGAGRARAAVEECVRATWHANNVRVAEQAREECQMWRLCMRSSPLRLLVWPLLVALFVPSCVGVQGHGEGRRAGAEAQD